MCFRFYKVNVLLNKNIKKYAKKPNKFNKLICFGKVIVIYVNMIFIFKYLIPKGFVGITLYPFIFLKTKKLKENVVLVNHEKIHLKQQLELLVIFFYLFYGIEWFYKFVKYKSAKLAYYNLSFEREAYINEKNLNYINERKTLAFLKYLK